MKVETILTEDELDRLAAESRRGSGVLVGAYDGLVLAGGAKTIRALKARLAASEAEAGRLRGVVERVEVVVAEVAGEMDVISGRLARGKGEWPGPSYVRDETWADWIGRRSTLDLVHSRLAAALAPSPPPPDWTATPPTGPGWYWAATEHGTRRIVNVVRNEGDEVVWRTTGYEGPLSEWALWWPVPLAPPPAPGQNKGCPDCGRITMQMESVSEPGRMACRGCGADYSVPPSPWAPGRNDEPKGGER